MSNNSPLVISNGPLAYLITFPTYGTWLHGDKRGSVDRDNNIPGTPILLQNKARQRHEQNKLQNKPVLLNSHARDVTHRTILQVSEHRGWTVHAINVRTNHIHVVVSAGKTPERVMNDLKSWCSRKLIEEGLFPPGKRLWVRHGSTRYLWKPQHLDAACRYVAEEQGVHLHGNE